MAQSVTIQGASYPDVPSILIPRTPSTVISEQSVTFNQALGFGYYCIVNGVAQYNYPALIAVYDGATYTLPLEPDPNGYAEGYIGYGASFSSTSSMDWSTYPIRVEDEDGQGQWRLYNQNGGSHTIKVLFCGNAVFTDTSDTTATASDVATGKLFYDALGVATLGTAGGNINLAMRPDAELVKVWSDDYLVHEDKEVTIPSYSTSAQNIIQAASLTEQTVDPTNYDYVLISKTLTIPIYNTTTAVKGRDEYHIGVGIHEYSVFPANTFKSINGSGKAYATKTTATISGTNNGRLLYWSSTSAVTLYATTAYGFYQTPQAPTSSTTSITPKTPLVGARGSTNYNTSTAWGQLKDIRCQYRLELYRAPKNALGQKGFYYQSAFMKIADDVSTNSHDLT